MNDGRTWQLAAWPRGQTRDQAGSADASVRSQYLDRASCWPGCQYIAPGSDDHPRCRSTQTSRYRSSLETHRAPYLGGNPAVPTCTQSQPARISAETIVRPMQKSIGESKIRPPVKS